MSNGFIKFAVLPGIHAEQAFIVKRVAVGRDAQFPDGIVFRLEFFSLQFAFDINRPAQLAGQDILFEGRIKSVKRLFQRIDNTGNPIIQLTDFFFFLDPENLQILAVHKDQK